MTTKSTNSFSPWVEKYRPTEFDKIVLNDINSSIFNNIIHLGIFPNILFHGPPGTGKTTTIINLIKKYQQKNNQESSDLIIHLNASDERGVDTIRNQINQFVSSKTMFNKGTKFVILDEVDYMTKPAQQALRCLLYNNYDDVRFCIICNYISRIDESLQTKFVKMQFNQLPPVTIVNFLMHISVQEQLNMTKKTAGKIQEMFGSDIRSMINYMQTNQRNMHTLKVVNNTTWNDLGILIKNKSPKLFSVILSICETHNTDLMDVLHNFFGYTILHKKHLVTPEYIALIENILNVSTDIPPKLLIQYVKLQLGDIYRIF